MTTDNGFLKNILDLEENPNKPDAFNLGGQYSYFEKKINQIPDKSIMAIVGDYGSGKSTMLNHIQNSSGGTARWITFDAWSYPERKALWDGLILKLALELLGESHAKSIEQKIDGNNRENRLGGVAKVVTSAASVAVAGFDLSSLIPDGILEKIGISFEDFQELSNSGPILRIEGFKKILRKILEYIGEKEIIVVLEDIDRAGIEGIFFLETLFQFLKFESSGDFKIKFIVPISRNSYHESIDSYMKCVDYFEFFNIKPEGIDAYVKFTENYFNQDIFLEYRTTKPLLLLSEFFYLFSRTHDISFRKLLLILRSANSRYVYLKNTFSDEGVNPYIVIILECMSYTHKVAGEEKVDYLSEFVKNRKISGRDIFGAMLHISQYKDDNCSLIRDGKVTEIFSTNEIRIRDVGGDLPEFYFKHLRNLPAISILRTNNTTIIRSPTNF